MKKLLSISLATVLCFGLSIPASAAAEDSLPAVNETEIVSTKEMFVNHPEFLSDAIITKTELDNNTYSFDFATQEEVPLSDSEKRLHSKLQKLSLSAKMKQKMLRHPFRQTWQTRPILLKELVLAVPCICRVIWNTSP